jgi:hypothetical protein
MIHMGMGLRKSECRGKLTNLGMMWETLSYSDSDLERFLGAVEWNGE